MGAFIRDTLLLLYCLFFFVGRAIHGLKNYVLYIKTVQQIKMVWVSVFGV